MMQNFRMFIISHRNFYQPRITSIDSYNLSKEKLILVL